MVTHTGEKASAGALRALKQPQPVAVKSDEDGHPIGLKLRGHWVGVETVLDRWRLDDEWWRQQPISRMYYECVVGQGIRATVFRDQVNGQWYLQR
jgi:hypothetical protein